MNLTWSWENSLEKSQQISEKLIHNLTNDDYLQIIEGVCTKNFDVTLLFVDFFKAFDSKQRRKMEQILLAYGLSKETVTTRMMLYKNKKAMVHSPI